MTHDPFFNSLSADSDGGGAAFTEEELLAYVEGELHPDRADSLSLQLLNDPGMFRRLEQMRINRSVLMSLPIERAPEHLLNRVTQALEQQTLLGSPLDEDITSKLKLVSDGTPLGGMRRMEYSRTPWYQSRLAMAAGVMLLLSGGLYWGWDAIRHTVQKDTRTFAAVTPRVDEIPPEPHANISPSESVVADNEPLANSPEEDPIRALVDSARPTPADLAAAISLPDRIISPEEAAQLARDGRLAIRVATLNTERAAAQVGKLANVRPEAARSWRLGTDLPESVLESVASAAERPSVVNASTDMADANHERTAPVADIGIHAQKSELLPPTAHPVQVHVATTPARKPVGFVVEVDAASNSLSAVKGLLSEKSGAVATFIELPAPVDSGVASEPSDIMWFTLGPENWVPRVRVPVLVGR